MVLPLIPIAIAGGLGGGIGSWLGKGKKEQSIETHAEKEYYAPTITRTEPMAHYHPRLVYQPTPTYTYTGGDIILDSPGARTKKETTIAVSPEAELSGAIDYPTTQTGATREGEGDIAGTNLTHIALIAAFGVLGYAVVTTLGDKKKK